MLRSLKAILKPVFILLQAAAATATSAYVDTVAGGSFTFLVNLEAFAFTGANNLVFSVLGKDATGDVGAAIPAEDLVFVLNGTVVPNGELKTTLAANSVLEIHYLGYKKLVALDIVKTGTVTSGLSVVGVHGHLDLEPPRAGVV